MKDENEFGYEVGDVLVSKKGSEYIVKSLSSLNIIPYKISTTMECICRVPDEDSNNKDTMITSESFLNDNFEHTGINTIKLFSTLEDEQDINYIVYEPEIGQKFLFKPHRKSINYKYNNYIVTVIDKIGYPDAYMVEISNGDEKIETIMKPYYFGLYCIDINKIKYLIGSEVIINDNNIKTTVEDIYKQLNGKIVYRLKDADHTYLDDDIRKPFDINVGDSFLVVDRWGAFDVPGTGNIILNVKAKISDREYNVALYRDKHIYYGTLSDDVIGYNCINTNDIKYMAGNHIKYKGTGEYEYGVVKKILYDKKKYNL